MRALLIAIASLLLGFLLGHRYWRYELTAYLPKGTFYLDGPLYLPPEVRNLVGGGPPIEPADTEGGK